MSSPDRPLSPHLSIYRWSISMALSILHRATGIALSIGLIALLVWLGALASGEQAYWSLLEWLESGLGRLLLIGWCAAFFLHLANGIRHLFWDAGRGFEIHQSAASGWFVVGATIILTTTYVLLF